MGKWINSAEEMPKSFMRVEGEVHYYGLGLKQKPTVEEMMFNGTRWMSVSGRFYKKDDVERWRTVRGETKKEKRINEEIAELANKGTSACVLRIIELQKDLEWAQRERDDAIQIAESIAEATRRLSSKLPKMETMNVITGGDGDLPTIRYRDAMSDSFRKFIEWTKSGGKRDVQ